MKRMRSKWLRLVAVAATLLASCPLAPVSAGTIYYSNDSLGRLSRVCNSLPGDGERTDYTLDSADNRSLYTNTKTDIALYANSGLTSADGRFILWMQSDGNLVLYRQSDAQALWMSNTSGSGAYVAYFQSDGNLVLYSSSGGVWSSMTYMYPCASLSVQNDGNVAIRSMDNQVVFLKGTSGQ